MAEDRRNIQGLLWVLFPLALFLGLEVATFFWVAQVLGWWTVALMIGVTLGGCWLLQREGGRTWNTMLQSLSTGTLPPGQTADAVLVLAGGVLLISPGFVSDVFGLLLLIAPTRRLIRSTVGRLFGRALSKRASGPTIIEGEVVAEPPTTPDSDPWEISPPTP
ncbi:MAG: FxsA family protein [Propionibacteriaceae bacterium]|nr:FxsA family protein [Propionibacteriaceae bacterium]